MGAPKSPKIFSYPLPTWKLTQELVWFFWTKSTNFLLWSFRVVDFLHTILKKENSLNRTWKSLFRHRVTWYSHYVKMLLVLQSYMVEDHIFSKSLLDKSSLYLFGTIRLARQDFWILMTAAVLTLLKQFFYESNKGWGEELVQVGPGGGVSRAEAIRTKERTLRLTCTAHVFVDSFLMSLKCCVIALLLRSRVSRQGECIFKGCPNGN